MTKRWLVRVFDHDGNEVDVVDDQSFKHPWEAKQWTEKHYDEDIVWADEIYPREIHAETTGVCPDKWTYEIEEMA